MRIRGGPMLLGASWPRWHQLARHGVSVAVLLALAVLSVRLILAPFHGTHDVAGCARAYAAARTHADTVSADFLSYPDPAGQARGRRCGTLRTATVDLNSR